MECGCSPENTIFKVGDKYILVEEYPYCENCEEDCMVGISELKKEDLEIFTDMEIKPKKLCKWMDRESKIEQFFIDPLKIDSMNLQLKNRIDETFDNVIEIIEEKKRYKRLKKIEDEDWQMLGDLFIKEFKKLNKEVGNSSHD